MLTSLAHRLVLVDRAREAFLARLRAATVAQRAFRPAPGSWSMLEVTEHLVLAEEKSLLGMLKGPPPGTTVTPVARVRMALVLLVLRTDFKVKVPVSRVVPQGNATLQELEQRWGAARRGLEAFLETVTQSGLHAARFRHPIGGWVSVGRGLAFYVDHIGHHARQLERIRRAAGFPVQ
ncbi:MAG TPA: DinB family protein [Gemmatimonadales bacterium]|nr:DinB family protein [Gemmatimonadales bacterium]